MYLFDQLKLFILAFIMFFYLKHIFFVAAQPKFNQESKDVPNKTATGLQSVNALISLEAVVCYIAEHFTLDLYYSKFTHFSAVLHMIL